MTKLRAKAREQGVIPARAEEHAGAPCWLTPVRSRWQTKWFGPLVYAVSEDPVAAAKVLSDFAKTDDKIIVKAGVYDGKLLDKAAVAQLASIPSREQLLGHAAGHHASPGVRLCPRTGSPGREASRWRRSPGRRSRCLNRSFIKDLTDF